MPIFNFNRPKPSIPLVLIASLRLIRPAYAQPCAYVSNLTGNNVSVIIAANNTIAATVSVAMSPVGPAADAVGL
jgi:YVTN family beta-propeller protein